MTVNYVVCSAGEGVRFHPLLGTIPKPLIRLQGTTLLEWALRSLPIAQGDVLVVITQARHGVCERMSGALEKAYPHCRVEWVELPGLTRGQLETALAAEPRLEEGAPLAIYNYDTYFQSDTLAGLMAEQEIEGIVPCSQEPGTAWSFCEVDGEDNVVRIEEKNRIAPWATAGLYFFRHAERFLARARAVVEIGGSGELYVAPLYQQYIDNGEVVRMDRVSVFKPMGTPEQVEAYWGISGDALKSENPEPA